MAQQYFSESQSSLVKKQVQPPAQQHSQPSVDAAEAIKPKAGTLRSQVFECIKSTGENGATDEEIQIALNMNPSTQRPRRIELVNANLIVACGFRKTKSGRQATIWKAV